MPRSTTRGGDAVNDPIAPITLVQTGRPQEIAFRADESIAQALKRFGVTVQKGQELRLNNRVITDRDTTLSPGDQLLVVGNIAGG